MYGIKYNQTLLKNNNLTYIKESVVVVNCWLNDSQKVFYYKNL